MCSRQFSSEVHISFKMPGRHRRSRGPDRSEFHNTQEQDQPSQRTRPARPLDSISQDRPRRRSNAQTHSQHSGIHRSNDYSNPVLNARLRNLKQHSDLVKRKLEDLIAVIDEMQPDSSVMDWSGSAGTIVYVPISTSVNGTFLQPQMKSINSTGDWPYYPPDSRQMLHDLEVTQHGMSSRPTPPTLTRAAILVSDNSDAERGVRNVGDMANERSLEERATVDVIENALNQQCNREAVGPKAVPDMPYRGGGISSWASQRVNPPRANVTSSLTPPSSPLAQRTQGRRESLGV